MSEVKEAVDRSAVPQRARVPVGSAVYNAVVEFLYDEAVLLDE